jgi:predicted negative regulator of RcsB-dependent stress response
VDENLTDQQRAAQIRDWLRDNGWYLLAGLVLGLGGLYGVREWRSYTTGHAEAASALYADLVTAVRAERAARAEEIAGQIVKDYGSTPYVDMARFTMAKLKMDQGVPDEAAAQLRKVVDKPSSAEIGHVARLRLARVLASQEKYDDALKLLAVPKKSAFTQRYHEVRGDVYYLMGKTAEARAEYESALKGEQVGAIDAGFVQAKLSALNGLSAASPAAAAAK